MMIESLGTRIPLISQFVRISTGSNWSYYYMHGAAPITQYMAASTQFNPLSQQIIIIIYVRAKLYVLGVIRNVRV